MASASGRPGLRPWGYDGVPERWEFNGRALGAPPKDGGMITGWSFQVRLPTFLSTDHHTLRGQALRRPLKETFHIQLDEHGIGLAFTDLTVLQ